MIHEQCPVSIVLHRLKELEEQFLVVPDCQSALQLHKSLSVPLIDLLAHFLC